MSYRKVFISTVTTVGILLSIYVAGLAIAIATKQSTTSNGWVNHTQLVTRQIQQVYTLPFELETEKRGYVLTGEDLFLKSYDATKENIDLHIKVLSSLVRDNPRQGENLLRLQSVVNEKVALFDAIIDARKSNGPEAAAAIVFHVEQKNLELTNRTKAVTDDMIRIEDGLLTVRDRASKWEFYQLVFAMMFLILRDVIWCGQQLTTAKEIETLDSTSGTSS